MTRRLEWLCLLLAVLWLPVCATAETRSLGCGVSIDLDEAAFTAVAGDDADEDALAALGLTRETFSQALEAAPSALIALAADSAIFYAEASELEEDTWTGLDDKALAEAYAGLPEHLNDQIGDNGTFELTLSLVETHGDWRTLLLVLDGTWFEAEMSMIRLMAQQGQVRVTLSLVVPAHADEAQISFLTALADMLTLEAQEPQTGA